MRSMVGIAGGSGGVGASTLAAVIAAVSGGVLVDVDATAGGIDVLLGVEDVLGARWSGVQVAGGRIDPGHVATALPRWGATPVLAADLAPDPNAVAAVLRAAGELGPVAVDLGRAGSQARDAAVRECALVVVVVAADLPGVAAARVMVASVDAPAALVVRRGVLAADEVADLVGAPVAGVLPRVKQRASVPLDPRRLPGAAVHVANGIADGLPR